MLSRSLGHRIRSVSFSNRPIWFVALLTGPDNTSDYTYLGVLRGNGAFATTAKSCQPADSEAAKVADWAIGKVWLNGVLKEGYKIEHAGRCGVCGRPLTTPESIECGIGPVCLERLGG